MNTRFLLKRRRDENSPSADGKTAKKCIVVLTDASKRSTDGERCETERLQINDTMPKSQAFNQDELRKALLPTLDTINARKLSKSFRVQLSTIKSKLSCGKYSDAREYVEDVWSMFESICLSNPNSEYTELADAFELEINPVMEKLGYCCGKNYRFDPQELYCALKEETGECTIPIDAHYFNHQARYNICENCFTSTPGDTITVNGDSSSQIRIRKDQFRNVQNNVATPEPFIDCLSCVRRQHKICVSYSERVWPDGFVCARCLASKGAKRTENRFKAKNLPVTKLDSHIEARVSNYLKQNKADDCGPVIVRVLLNTDETVAVRPAMRNLFVESGEMSAAFPYRSKAIFAFQEIDGVDVCFFGFFVQEYGSECPSPNTRRVYITFLDSVNFFRPKDCRTAVYHEILLGYMEYVKQLGYVWLHIWASPPPFGENYIFFKHPTDQKIPDESRLLKWYTTVLRKGKKKNIIVDFKNILQQSQKDRVSTAARLPYFDGDYWPDFFEQTIQKSTAAKREAGRKQNFKSKTKNKSVRFYPTRTTKQKIVLMSRLLSAMAQVKNQFLSVRLLSDETAATLGPIVDTDHEWTSCIMNNHAFFGFARDNDYEFSSLRRAKFSTMCILYELHNQANEIDYICNICKSETDTWYHCRVCEDYDLCVDCHEKIGHAHEMDRIESNSVSELPPSQPVNAVASDKRTSPSGIIEIDSDTSDDEAPPNVEQPEQTHPLSMCAPMRALTRHVKSCQKIYGACHICQWLDTSLSMHLKNCRNANCSYSVCRDRKAQIERQQQQRKERQYKDFMLETATTLQKLSFNFLDNRKVTDPKSVLNWSSEIARVLLRILQEIGNSTAQMAEDRDTSAQAQN